MRFEFIQAEKATYPVTVLCHVLRVSRSGFYAWKSRGESKRAQENEVLLKAIERVHRASRNNYGSPRVVAELRARGHKVGHNRVARIMRENGIVAKMRRRYRVTTQAGQRPPAKSLLRRDFTARRRNRKWVSDITYIPTREGWLYLSVIVDLYSRAVVGWSMSRWISHELVLKALGMAVGRRRVQPGLILHSDQGRQYTSLAFQRALRCHRMVSSMSRKGDCWDNAVAESFFATLKRELSGCHSGFEDRAQARRQLFDYIEVFYNRQRRHSTLGYLSPLAFELSARGRAA